MDKILVPNSVSYRGIPLYIPYYIYTYISVRLELYFMSNVTKSVSENSVQVKWLDLLPLGAIQEGYSVTSLIIRTIQLFEHPPFPGKMINIVFHVFKHPRLSLYSNIQTPTPCGALTGVAEHLLAFDKSSWIVRSYSESYQLSSSIL